jgi:predicted RNase H-like HicB family nuclease
MRQYIALIHKDASSDYGVSFPDLPGCVTAGTTLDQARDMAEEAVTLHLAGLTADGLAAPEPSSLDDVMRDPGNLGGVAVLVNAEEEARDSVRVNIELPADLLDAVDRFAEAEGSTRSMVLAKAARNAIRKAS